MKKLLFMLGMMGCILPGQSQEVKTTFQTSRPWKRSIDVQADAVMVYGISEIFLEEPEFWAYAGYSEAFKREWDAETRTLLLQFENLPEGVKV